MLSPSNKWQCSNKKHPSYAVMRNFVRHLIDVHNIDLQVPELTAEEIANTAVGRES